MANPFKIVSDEVNRTINNVTKGRILDGAMGVLFLLIFFLGVMGLITLIM